jgi:hypothetical protein
MTKNSISFAVGIVIGLSLISAGVTSFVAPRFASVMFGVAAADHSARVYVYATGMRDIVIGCWLVAVLGAGSRMFGVSLMILALIPIGDAIIVWMNTAAPGAVAFALHISSAIVFLVLGFWFRLGR